MSREILMHSHGSETEIAIRENGILVEFYVEKEGEGSIVGNLFKGIVRTVIPSMQAAFVESLKPLVLKMLRISFSI